MRSRACLGGPGAARGAAARCWAWAIGRVACISSIWFCIRPSWYSYDFWPPSRVAAAASLPRSPLQDPSSMSRASLRLVPCRVLVRAVCSGYGLEPHLVVSEVRVAITVGARVFAARS